MKDTIPSLDIPSKKKIKEVVYPCDYYFQKSKQEMVRGLDGQMSFGGTILEWEKRLLYETKLVLYEADDFDFNGYKEKLEKAIFKILLLFQQGEKKYSYHFSFKPEVTEK